jgi:hypothetical protein
MMKDISVFLDILAKGSITDPPGRKTIIDSGSCNYCVREECEHDSTTTTTSDVHTTDSSFLSIGGDTSFLLLSLSTSTSMLNSDNIEVDRCGKDDITIENQNNSNVDQILYIDESLTGTSVFEYDTPSLNTIIDSLFRPTCYEVSNSFLSMGMFLSSNESYDTFNCVDDEFFLSSLSSSSLHQNGAMHSHWRKTSDLSEMYEPCFNDIQSLLHFTLKDSYCGSIDNDDKNEKCTFWVDNVVQFEQKIQQQPRTTVATEVASKIDCGKVSRGQQQHSFLCKTVSSSCGSSVQSKNVPIDVHNVSASQCIHKKMKKLDEEKLSPSCNCICCTLVSSVSSCSKSVSTKNSNKNQHQQQQSKTKKRNSKSKALNFYHQSASSQRKQQKESYFSNNNSCIQTSAKSVDDRQDALSLGSISSSSIETSFCSLSVVLLSLIISNTTVVTSSQSMSVCPKMDCIDSEKKNNYRNNNKNDSDYFVSTTNTSSGNVCTIGSKNMNNTACSQNSSSTNSSCRRPCLVGSVMTSHSNCSSDSLGTDGSVSSDRCEYKNDIDICNDTTNETSTLSSILLSSISSNYCSKMDHVDAMTGRSNDVVSDIERFNTLKQIWMNCNVNGMLIVSYLLLLWLFITICIESIVLQLVLL